MANSLRVTEAAGHKVFNLSVASALPDWVGLSNRGGKKKKKKDGRSTMYEIIQDFGLPDTVNHLRLSENGRYIFASGGYPPRFRVFDTTIMGMRYERAVDHSILDFLVLTEDGKKSVFLLDNNRLEFHLPGSKHAELSVPFSARTLNYHYPTCDLLISGYGNQILRYNLHQGQYGAPIDIEDVQIEGEARKNRVRGISAGHINPVFGLWAFGSQNGAVHFIDPRSRNQLTSLVNAPQYASSLTGTDDDVEISAVKFSNDGLSIGVGTSTGVALLYDLRSNKPFGQKDHRYGFPIIDFTFHQGTNKVITTDQRIIKIWDSNRPGQSESMNDNFDGGDAGGDQFNESSALFSFIEPGVPINSVCIPNRAANTSSGVLLVATSNPSVSIYYIPSLGFPPKWCEFLDNYAEELQTEKARESVYEDYQYVLKEDLEKLGLAQMIGTPYLEAYMHGYLIRLSLYNKLTSLANQPTPVDEKEKIEEKVANASRIDIKSVPTVNKNLAANVMSSSKSGQKILNDPRLAEIFTNKEFEVNPLREVRGAKKRSKETSELSKEDIMDAFDEVEDEAEQSTKTRKPKMMAIKEGVELNDEGFAKKRKFTLEERLSSGTEVSENKRIAKNANISYIPQDELAKAKEMKGERKQHMSKRTDRRKAPAKIK